MRPDHRGTPPQPENDGQVLVSAKIWPWRDEASHALCQQLAWVSNSSKARPDLGLRPSASAEASRGPRCCNLHSLGDNHQSTESVSEPCVSLEPQVQGTMPVCIELRVRTAIAPLVILEFGKSIARRVRQQKSGGIKHYPACSWAAIHLRFANAVSTWVTSVSHLF